MTKVVEVLIGGRLSYIDIKVIFNGVRSDIVLPCLSLIVVQTSLL